MCREKSLNVVIEGRAPMCFRCHQTDHVQKTYQAKMESDIINDELETTQTSAQPDINTEINIEEKPNSKREWRKPFLKKKEQKKD